MKTKLLSAWLRCVVAGSLLAASLPSFGDTPQLVHDIRTTSQGHSSSPENLCKLGSTLYFARTDSAHGNELWKSSGTSASSVRVKDIFPGSIGSNPSDLTAVGSTLYFVADNGVNGRELWKSDGTEAGTVMVKDIAAGGTFTNGPVPRNLMAVGGMLFFTAVNPLYGRELWKSDGTAAGTAMVLDIYPGPAESSLAGFAASGGTLYFSAVNATQGSELWKSDGTVAGTAIVRDIVPGAGSGFPGGMTVVGGALYFVANDPAYGLELWKSNGTEAGTAPLKDIVAGPGGSMPHSLTAVGSELYLNANDGVHGDELWRSDGTGAGTVMVQDIVPGPEGSGPYRFTGVTGPSGNRCYFLARNSLGLGLWTSGQFSGTMLMGLVSDSSVPDQFTAAGDILYFTYDNGSQGYEVWTCDGSSMALLEDIVPGPGTSIPNGLTAMDDTLYFAASSPFEGRELWKSGGFGLGGGASLVSNLEPGGSSAPSPVAAVATITGGAVCFAADDDFNGRELWISTGNGFFGTAMVKDINPGTAGSSPANLVSAGGRVFFTADDGMNGIELWSSDGTEAGTHMLKDINFGPESSNPSELIALGGTVFFKANAGAGGYGVWKSDGTPWGTTLLAVLGPVSYYPIYPAVAGNQLYFAGYDSARGYELWRSDGTAAGTTLVKDIHPGSESSYPYEIRAAGDLIYFTANDGTHGGELWKSDGTPDGTVLVKDARPGSGDSIIAWMTVSGDRVFYDAYSSTAGRELWTSDGTAEGTLMMKDIKSGIGSGDIQSITAAGGGTVYFTASDGTPGAKLWKSDGTSGGTVVVKDLWPGGAASLPVNLMMVDGILHFTANDGIHGEELWKSDGTPGGTVMVADLVAGSGAASPSQMKQVRGALYFSATTATQGTELWKLAFPDTNLAGLVLSVGSLSPGFDSLVTGYTARVPKAASSITLTPTLSDNAATMTVNGNPAGSNSPYGPVPLVIGSNLISIAVTASDGISTKTYTILVTRLSAIEEWRQTWFGTIANAGIAADVAAPDGDGIENLLKYGLVLPPRAHDGVVLPVPQKRTYAEGTRMAMIFTRDPLRDDVVIRVQATSELALPWTTLATSTNGGPFSGPGLVWEIDASQGLKTVEVRDTVNISAAQRRFLRVSVSR